MRIRMKVEMSGTRNSQPWPKVGGEIDLPDDEAVSYCAAGLAEPATEVAEVETTTPAEDSEKTVIGDVETTMPPDDSEKAVPSRRGRPPGSKNKPKE